MIESGLESRTYAVGKRVLSDQPSATLQNTRPIPRTHSAPARAGSIMCGSVRIRVEGDGTMEGLRAGIQWYSTVMYDPECQHEGRPTTTGHSSLQNESA